MRGLAMLALMLLPGVSALAVPAGPAQPGVVAFNASVRVEVDAAGKPVVVEAPATLPAAVRSFIERRVGMFRYEPATRNGVPAPATTFVEVGACALPTPSGDGFRLGLDFKGNGPRVANKSQRLMPPMYPPEAAQRGYEGSFHVLLDVRPDGSTRVASITPLATNPPRGSGAFDATLKKWGRSQRFEPEVVAGQAVATQVQVPVDFSVAGVPREAYKEALVKAALDSSECRLASGQQDGGLRSMALDSPVKVTPVTTPAS